MLREKHSKFKSSEYAVLFEDKDIHCSDSAPRWGLCQHCKLYKFIYHYSLTWESKTKSTIQI